MEKGEEAHEYQHEKEEDQEEEEQLDEEDDGLDSGNCAHKRSETGERAHEGLQNEDELVQGRVEHEEVQHVGEQSEQSKLPRGRWRPRHVEVGFKPSRTCHARRQGHRCGRSRAGHWRR